MPPARRSRATARRPTASRSPVRPPRRRTPRRPGRRGTRAGTPDERTTSGAQRPFAHGEPRPATPRHTRLRGCTFYRGGVAKTWVLDTETKGTGAHVVPYDETVQKGRLE